MIFLNKTKEINLYVFSLFLFY